LIPVLVVCSNADKGSSKVEQNTYEFDDGVMEVELSVREVEAVVLAVKLLGRFQLNLERLNIAIHEDIITSSSSIPLSLPIEAVLTSLLLLRVIISGNTESITPNICVFLSILGKSAIVVKLPIMPRSNKLNGCALALLRIILINSLSGDAQLVMHAEVDCVQ
jgi:hypothetical protein